MTHKIAVVSIMKNESQFIKRWADSAKEADYLILLDTGSTDDSVKVAKKNGVIVHEKVFNPWRFDHARNHLLDLIPDDVDYVINLDVDEVLVAGWREKMDAVPSNITRPRYKYVWSWKEDGTEGLVYGGDKIAKRHGYRWKHPVHEVMIPTGEHTEMFVEGLEIHHHPDNTKSRSQYLPLLLQSVEEDPEDDRNTYYCARELFFVGQFEEAGKMFLRHLALPRAVWEPERAFSMRFLAKIYAQDRERWLLRACAEYPYGREPWVDLAQHYYNENNWPGCYFAAAQALRITEKPLLYLNEEAAWGFYPYDLLAIAAHRMGMNNIAIAHGAVAAELLPEEERLKTNMFFYRNADTQVNVVIPFKSHVVGLIGLLADLSLDAKVNKIVVVADGEDAFNKLKKIDIGMGVVRVMVPEGSGIHVMWNLGMDICGDEHPICFINDDVRLEKNCISSLAAALDKNQNFGLVCPNYSDTEMSDSIVTYKTCRGVYDGTGGIAGFCMMLAKDLVKDYRFDTNMKWWFGDDDIVNWVVRTKKRLAVVTHTAKCTHEHSYTLRTNPPKDFVEQTEKDREYFEKKWNSNA